MAGAVEWGAASHAVPERIPVATDLGFPGYRCALGSPFISVADSTGLQVRQPAPFFLYLPLWNHDSLYDASRSRLWVSVPSQAPLYGGSVVLLDPATGNVELSVPLGAEPELLALSGDSLYLYVSSPGQIYQLDTTTLQFYSGFPLPAIQFGSEPNEALSMKVLPGQSDSLVVSIGTPDGFASYDGMVLFRAGVALSRRLYRSDGGRFLAGFSADGSLLSVDGSLVHIAIEADGLAVIRTANLTTGQGNCPLENGLLYCQSGAVIDPSADSYAGEYGAYGMVAPLPAADRIAFLTAGEQIEPSGAILCPLTIFRLSNGDLMQSWLVPFGGMGDSGAFLRWGANGVAYRDAGFNVFTTPSDRLYLFQVQGTN